MAVGMDWIVQHTQWPLLVPGYGGIFGPTAIASALFGDFSPSGKLPYTVYPEVWANRTQMKDMDMTAGDGRTYKWYGYKDPTLKATFEVGTGISYTTFNVSVNKLPTWSQPSTTIAQFEVGFANTGEATASEAILIYARMVNVPDAPQPTPKRQLINFARSPVLRPGEHFKTKVPIHIKDLSVVDVAGKRATYNGLHEIVFSNGSGIDTVQQLHIA